MSAGWNVRGGRAWLGAGCMVALLLITTAGCHRGNANESAERAASQSGGKRYAMKGIIVAKDARKNEVIVDTEAIPGFMDAMTMPYKVEDASVLQDLHPGDHMTGQLVMPEQGDAVVREIVITQQAKPDYKPAVQFHVPAPGDRVPDFHFVNQNGKQISIDSFRGEALLVTFIYTRCPLSDYCPRMSRNFAEIDKALARDPKEYAKTHLLSISFDPAYDSPAVLRSYGSAYTGNYTKETFKHWDFAAPKKDDLAKVLQFFDVGATPEKDRTITHSLSTAVITPDGRIAAWYPANDWSVNAVLEALKQAADGAQKS